MRDDLRALDDDKLAQLANRGLVKRARKMLACETDYQLALEHDGTLILRLQDVESRLPPGVALSDSECSCGARGVCRHLLFAVMAHNADQLDSSEEVSWNPGDLADQALEELLGPRAVASARRVAGKGLQVELRGGPPPVCLLPTCTVTFLVPHSPAHATCDCAQSGPCEHLALAVWAFRLLPPGQASDRVELGLEKERSQTVDRAHQLMTELLAEGVPGARKDLPERLRRAARELSREKMVWMGDLLEDVASAVLAYHDRAAYYDPQRTARWLAEWFARERASRAAGELSTALVLGLGEAPETALEHTRLTSLGARLRRRKERVFAEVFLADPDTSTVLVLNRDWPADKRVDRVTVQRGMLLKDLAAGQLVTSTARRKANRTLTLGTSRVAQSAVFAQAGEWNTLLRPPLLVHDFSVLLAECDREIPSFLRPRVKAERVRAFQIASVEKVWYQAGAQTLWARITDEAGFPLLLRSEYSAASPGALSSLFQQLQSEPRFVSGELSTEPEGLVVEPLAVVADQGLVVPSMQPEQSMDGVFLGAPDPLDAFETLLGQASDSLTGLAHGGLLHSASTGERLELQLKDMGLRGLAECFEVLAERLLALSATGCQAEFAGEAWADSAIRLELTREVWLADALAGSAQAFAGLGNSL